MLAIQDLLNIQPAFSNLFEVRVTPSSAGGQSLPAGHQFLCSKISFPGSGLEFERNKTTKLFQLTSGYKYADEVSITWREAKDYRVRTFHQAWFDRFYNREEDVYVTGTVGKFYNISVTVMDDSKKLELFNVIPTAFPNLELEYASSTPLEYSLNYKVERWTFR